MSDGGVHTHLETDSRRAFLRKAMVAGGIAVGVPMVTTFNVPAAADHSAPGMYRVQFQRSTSNQNSFTRVTPTDANLSTTCAGQEGAWDGAQADPGIEASLSSSNNVTIQLTGADATSCQIQSAFADGDGSCLNGTLQSGGDSVTFSRSALASGANIYLLVNCTA